MYIGVLVIIAILRDMIMVILLILGDQVESLGLNLAACINWGFLWKGVRAPLRWLWVDIRQAQKFVLRTLQHRGARGSRVVLKVDMGLSLR